MKPPNFDWAVNRTLKAEGHWSDHSDDPGGATKYGVTYRVAKHHGFDVASLTVDQAKAIYRVDYWERCSCDRLASGLVAAELFDTAVNVGVWRASRMAQYAANLVGWGITDKPLVGDGEIGLLTLARINDLSERYELHLVAAMNGYQFDHYVDLWHGSPDRFGSFVRGWMLRCLPPLEVPDGQEDKAGLRGLFPSQRA
jgi:lysozyme family protein